MSPSSRQEAARAFLVAALTYELDRPPTDEEVQQLIDGLTRYM